MRISNTTTPDRELPQAGRAAADTTMPVAVAAAAGRHFALSRSYPHLRERAFVPIAASELVNVAQDLPLLFNPTADGWEVVGITDAAVLRQPVVDTRGAWRGEYVPMALRLHPFLVDGDGVLSIDLRGLREPPEGYPFLDAAGSPSDRLKRVIASLDAAREGIRRLGERVDALNAAGLLVPLPLLFTFDTPCEALAGLFGVDSQRLAALSNDRLAGLVEHTPSALDLAVASMFATRRLAAGLVARSGNDEDTIAARIDAGLRLRPEQGGAPAPAVGGSLLAPPPESTRLGYSLDASISLDFSGLSF